MFRDIKIVEVWLTVLILIAFLEQSEQTMAIAHKGCAT